MLNFLSLSNDRQVAVCTVFQSDRFRSHNKTGFGPIDELRPKASKGLANPWGDH